MIEAITRLAVHAVLYRRGARDSVNVHVGGLTASGNQSRGLGEGERDAQNGDETAQKEIEVGGVKRPWGSRPRGAPQREERGGLGSGDGRSVPREEKGS